MYTPHGRIRTITYVLIWESYVYRLLYEKYMILKIIKLKYEISLIMKKILYVSYTIYYLYLYFRNYPLGVLVSNHHPCPCHPENLKSKKLNNFFGFSWRFCMNFLRNQMRMNFFRNQMGDGDPYNKSKKHRGRKNIIFFCFS